jgi:hypothetical protein
MIFSTVAGVNTRFEQIRISQDDDVMADIYEADSDIALRVR